MQKLWCTSFEGFKTLVEANGWDKSVPDDVAIISINNGVDTCPVNECHLCSGENVLNLDFDDVDPGVLNLPSNVVKASYQTATGETTILQFFTDEQAQTAVDFIEKHKDKNFYVHCSAGISRSQAFIRYINTIYDELWYRNPQNPCVHPNGYVLQKLMQCWRKKNNYENIFQ